MYVDCSHHYPLTLSSFSVQAFPQVEYPEDTYTYTCTVCCSVLCKTNQKHTVTGSGMILIGCKNCLFPAAKSNGFTGYIMNKFQA